MEELIKNLQMIISIITLLGVVYAIYRTFSDPNISAKNRMDVMDDRCLLQHKNLDEDISEIKGDLKLVKENHLRHIEDRLGNIERTQERILTILEYEKSSFQKGA